MYPMYEIGSINTPFVHPCGKVLQHRVHLPKINEDGTFYESNFIHVSMFNLSINEIMHNMSIKDLIQLTSDSSTLILIPTWYLHIYHCKILWYRLYTLGHFKSIFNTMTHRVSKKESWLVYQCEFHVGQLLFKRSLGTRRGLIPILHRWALGMDTKV